MGAADVPDGGGDSQLSLATGTAVAAVYRRTRLGSSKGGGRCAFPVPTDSPLLPPDEVENGPISVVPRMVVGATAYGAVLSGAGRHNRYARGHRQEGVDDRQRADPHRC